MAPAWLEKFIVRDPLIPDPRLNNEQPSLEIHYTDVGDHRRILKAVGDTEPCYAVRRKTVLEVWGDKYFVTSPREADKEIAWMDFHSIPPSTEINFTSRNDHVIKIKGSQEAYESSGGLGRLHWKPTSMVPYGEASWELRDEQNLVLSVTIDHRQMNGVISIWKEKIEPKTVEELIVVGISQLEGYKRLLRTSKISGVMAVA
ncbi:hypothetical protein B0I35DRAFT_360543 [Stachybotrys elegans]|uniref:Uncharacterized protein n=1 Tax=Stachybotrys elegans TaxID=80388 RepID=A0A8K0SHX8_9HYPO|nr:hypothetical protein B0I35DRAFT_360543 [Stachybotrys elegans]